MKKECGRGTALRQRRPKRMPIRAGVSLSRARRRLACGLAAAERRLEQMPSTTRLSMVSFLWLWLKVRDGVATGDRQVGGVVDHVGGVTIVV